MQGKGYRRIGKRISDDFDSGHPVAELIRELTPEVAPIRAGAMDRIVSNVLAIQGSAVSHTARGGPRAWKFALVAAGMVIAAALFTAIWLFTPGDKTAVPAGYAGLEGLSGDVRVMQAGGAWRGAEENTRLEPGDSVRTGSGSRAVLKFKDGSKVRVTDDSELRIMTLGEASVDVEHLEGETYHRVEKGTRYVVWKGDISLRALGTAFNVNNRDPKNIEVVTVESKVAVGIGRHRPIPVAQGEMISVNLSEKKADKQPVSRERLEEPRLKENVREDKKEGYTTGIYEELKVPLEEDEEGRKEGPEPDRSVPAGLSLKGSALEDRVSLEWERSGEDGYDTLVLLRSGTELPPAYPVDEIARFTDTAISRAEDNGVAPGVYQYRLVALAGSEELLQSNTIVVKVPEPKVKPEKPSVSLLAAFSGGQVVLEWTVSGVTVFDGYLVERTVTGAPSGSRTPKGDLVTRRIPGTSVFLSDTDKTVLPGHSYTYRIGVLVGGAAAFYSQPQTVDVPPR